MKMSSNKAMKITELNDTFTSTDMSDFLRTLLHAIAIIIIMKICYSYQNYTNYRSIY